MKKAAMKVRKPKFRRENESHFINLQKSCFGLLTSFVSFQNSWNCHKLPFSIIINKFWWSFPRWNGRNMMNGMNDRFWYIKISAPQSTRSIRTFLRLLIEKFLYPRCTHQTCLYVSSISFYPCDSRSLCNNFSKFKMAENGLMSGLTQKNRNSIGEESTIW